MNSDETVVRLRDVVDIFDGPHATPQKTDVGPVFLGISSLNKGKLDLDQSARLSEHDFLKWTKRVTPRPRDVVFSYETRLGEAAIIPDGLRCCLGRRMGLMRVKDTEALLPEFLLYAYLGPEFQALIEKRTIHGSTVDRLSLTEFPDFPFRVPAIRAQQQICSILGSLDASIEVLQRQNAALEVTAQTLFRSWFVQFDPVHAKAAGQAPEAMSARLASLFPSEFEESELGPIPKGWMQTSFGEAFQVKGGGTPSTSEAAYWSGGTHKWATPKDMSGLPSKVIYETERKLTSAGVQKISSRVLPEGTVLMSSRAPVGYLAVTKAPISINQGFIAIPPTDGFPPTFVLELLSHKMPLIKQNSGGSTFAEISKSQFRPIKWVRPPAAILEHFGRVTEPMYAAITANCHVVDTLASLRDHLLPRLISGKLSLEEAQEAVEELIPA